MNNVLRKVAVLIGIGILFVSMYWSQDGFNFDVAGESGYGEMAVFIGWFLAVCVSVVQFVFSTNYKDLNPSLILFGVLAYLYSMYTNFQGILHFQGEDSSKFGAVILAIVMDGVAEPLIAWGLYESRSGDFIGNIIRAAVTARKDPENQAQGNRGGSFRAESGRGDRNIRVSGRQQTHTTTQRPVREEHRGKLPSAESLAVLYGVKSKKERDLEENEE